MRTSFHHQPEAQHPKSPAIYTPAGRLPHLLPQERTSASLTGMSAKCQSRHFAAQQKLLDQLVLRVGLRHGF